MDPPWIAFPAALPQDWEVILAFAERIHVKLREIPRESIATVSLQYCNSGPARF
jgi:hypothetical protein